jgi:hypothetical protein
MNRSEQSSQPTWWHIVIGVGAVLVILTFLAGTRMDDTAFIWKVAKQFNLGVELNFATWWSSALLFGAALLAYELFSTQRSKLRAAWLILTAVFTALSLDELGGLHERIGELSWLFFVPIGAIAALALAYAFYQLLQERAMHRSTGILLLGFALLGTIIVQEFLEFAVDWTGTLRALRMAVEEGTELVGQSLLLWGMIRWRNYAAFTALGQNTPHGIMAGTPRPSVMKHILIVMCGALAAQAVVTLMTNNLTDTANHGDPSMWFPVALFIFLAAAIFERSRFAGSNALLLQLAALGCLIASLVVVYFIGRQNIAPLALWVMLLAWCVVVAWRLTASVSRMEIIAGIVLSVAVGFIILLNLTGAVGIITSILALGIADRLFA